jgi:hypothetical protein
MRTTSVFCACLALALLAGPARASISYEYVTDQSTYTGNVGDTVTVSVLLQESVSGSSSLLKSESGLFSGGFYAFQSNSPSSPSTITGVSQNKLFDGFNRPNFNGQQASMQQAESFSDTGGVAGTQNGNTTTVLLGTISIKVGSSSTTYTVESFRFAPKTFGGSGVDGNTLSFNSNFDLDVTNNGTAGGATYTGADAFNDTGNPFGAFTFTVTTATPEPGSLVLGAVAASGLALGAWRRWKARRREGA